MGLSTLRTPTPNSGIHGCVTRIGSVIWNWSVRSSMAAWAQRYALLQLSSAPFLRPAPNSVLLLCLRVGVMSLKSFGAPAVSTRLSDQPLSPSFPHPLGLISGLLLVILVRHDRRVVQASKIHKASCWQQGQRVLPTGPPFRSPPKRKLHRKLTEERCVVLPWPGRIP